MVDVSTRQLYDLALEIVRGVVRLEASLDGVLREVRSLNQEISSTRLAIRELSERSFGTFPQ
jgi:hypothetical protein